MNDAALRDLLAGVKNIAVIGAKDKPGPVDRVGRWLIGAGYTVFPVHPVRKDVWGLPTYATLTDVPGPVDLVDVFRVPEHCPAHAQEAAALPARPRIFWLQLGIVSPEARKIAETAGMQVVEDACLMVDLQRLFPFGIKQ